MNRRILVPLGVAVALAIFVGAALLSGGSPPEPAVPAPAPGAEPALASRRVDLVIDEASATTPERAESRIDPRAIDGPEVASQPACVVLGRVVDEEGRPLAAARVRLQAWKVWAEGVDVPRLDGAEDVRGFEVATDAAGEFRIGAPVPTAERTWLTVEPDRFHDSVLVDFASERRGARPPLVAGERDLGILRVAATGAIRGRVVDADGAGIGGVNMDVGPSMSHTYQRFAVTADDGSYLIAHAPVGTYGVKAKGEGYLHQFREPVVVEAARDTRGVDFVLERAPTIEGVVVDEAGRPLEGARLWGWPASIGAGSGAGAKSDAEGRFVVNLPKDEALTLGASLAGYSSWGNDSDRSVTYAPGTRDLRIVLEALPATRFEVVDGETGLPLEHFGIRVLANNGSRSRPRIHTGHGNLRPEAHPGGVVELAARPGIDAYVVVAEGYLEASGDVEHEAESSPRQVVRMERGAAIVGRVLRAGQPLASTRVDVELGMLALPPGETISESAQFEFHGTGGKRSALSEADGRFEVRGLAGGAYRLTVRPDHGAPLVVVPLQVPARERFDAGDLSILRGAAIEGRVLLPPGVAPGGLTVWLDDWREGVSAVTDGAGAFHLAELAPGPHALILGERAGELAGGARASLELAPGETAAATIDARDRATCAVTLAVVLDGRPAVGMQVDLVSAADRAERLSLGKTDEAGRALGYPRAWGEALVVLHTPARALEHPSARLLLEPSIPVDASVAFETASLSLVLPRGVEPPRSGQVVLTLGVPGAEHASASGWLRFREGVAEGSKPQAARYADGVLWFGTLPAGRYELTLETVDDATKMELVPVAGGESQIAKPAAWSATRTVELLAGEELRVELE